MAGKIVGGPIWISDWVVANDAVTRALLWACATGTEKRDVTAGDGDAAAGTGDGYPISINIGDIDTRTVVLWRIEGGLDLRVTIVLSLVNPKGACQERRGQSLREWPQGLWTNAVRWKERLVA